jgi:enamine deaminase RidA (YjgF/YER057c/UK114 family)
MCANQNYNNLILFVLPRMSKVQVTAPGAPPSLAPYSHAIKANGLVFCSGQVGLDKVSISEPSQNSEIESLFSITEWRFNHC